ncbi:MAG: DUF4097 domain-containing protein [Acidobacteria bacterium]|nr:DUF4097 domain-containing protein [Acidobacteriota bacterium]
MKHRATAILLITSSLAAAGCWEPEPTTTVTLERTFDATELRKIDVRTVNGRVEVVADSTPLVTLSARLELPEDIDPAEFLLTEIAGDVLNVREEWGRRSWRHKNGGGTYTFTIPSSMELDLSTTNGKILTTGIEAAQDVSTVNGRIEIETPSSRVHADSVNGGITAVYTSSFPGGEFSSVNGSIKIEVPETTRLAADIHQVNGSFNSEIPVTVGSSDREAVVLSASTVNGGITVSRTRTTFRDSNTSTRVAPVVPDQNTEEIVVTEEAVATEIERDERDDRF